VVSRSAPSTLRRTADDVTAVSSITDVANSNKRRLLIVDTRPLRADRQQIDISSQNKLTELNSCRKAINSTTVTDLGGLHNYADVSGAVNGHFGNQCHVTQINRIDMEEKLQSVTVSRKNKLVKRSPVNGAAEPGQRRSTNQFGRVGRFQKSPHPNWLSAVLEDRTTKRPLVTHFEIDGHIGFVPLSVPEDDTRSTSSDDSVTQETLYYDEYGWQCVTAV